MSAKTQVAAVIVLLALIAGVAYHEMTRATAASQVSPARTSLAAPVPPKEERAPLPAAASPSPAAIVAGAVDQKSQVLLQRLREGWQRNYSLIDTITGQAVLHYEREAQGDDLKAQGISSATDSLEVRFWRSGPKFRLEIRSLPLPEGVKRLTDGRKVTVLSDENRIIFFNEWSTSEGTTKSQVVTQVPWVEVQKNLRLFGSYDLDPMLFFKIGDKMPFEWLDRARADGSDISVAALPGESEFLATGRERSPEGRPSRILEIGISEAAGFNATSMHRYPLGQERLGQFASASYSDWDSQGKVFFPRGLDFRMLSEGFQENLSLDVTNVRINPPIENKIFTLEDLGIPVGTPVHDFRHMKADNQPESSRYGVPATPAMPEAASEPVGIPAPPSR